MTVDELLGERWRRLGEWCVRYDGLAVELRAYPLPSRSLSYPVYTMANLIAYTSKPCEVRREVLPVGLRVVARRVTRELLPEKLLLEAVDREYPAPFSPAALDAAATGD